MSEPVKRVSSGIQALPLSPRPPRDINPFEKSVESITGGFFDKLSNLFSSGKLEGIQSALKGRVQNHPSESQTTVKAAQVVHNRFYEVAASRGMTSQQIQHQEKFISENFQKWVSQNQLIRIKKGGEGNLARTLEYLPETQTVVTHFKTKGGDILGEGAFAKVKQSIVNVSMQLEVGIDIADKVPLRREGVEGLIREGRITKKFNYSQNVRGCYRVNTKGLLLEGMDNNLSSILRQGGILSPAEKLAAGRDLVNGMVEMHEAGYVHQDLHTGNLFVSSRGIWKVGDLGTAQEIGQINHMPTNLKIASPESMRALLFNARAKTSTSNDIWSLGISFYEMEYGQPPPFCRPAVTGPIQRGIQERADVLKEILKLPIDLQEVIFNWNGKAELQTPIVWSDIEIKTFKELATRFKKIQDSLEQKCKSYQSLQQKFLQQFVPRTKLDQLVLNMLVMDPNERIASRRVLQEINSMDVENYYFEKAVELEPSDFAEEQPYAARAELPYAAGGELPYSAGVELPYAAGVELPYAAGAGEPSIPSMMQRSTSDVPTQVGSLELAFEEVSLSPQIKSDETILLECIDKQDIRKIQELILGGCNVTGWRDINGNTLAHLAAKNSQKNLVLSYLLQHGADTNAKNSYGETPLHKAVEASNIQGAKMLLSFGSDPLALDEDRITPLDIAQEKDLFLDENNLLIAGAYSKPNPHFVNFYLNQAFMLEFLTERAGVTEQGKEQLALLSLNAFSKAAAVGDLLAKAYQIQTSPIFPSETRYHRSTENELVNEAEKSVAKAWSLPDPTQIQIIHSSLFREVLARDHCDSGKIFVIKSETDIETLAKYLVENSNRSGEELTPPHVVVDFTEWVGIGPRAPQKADEFMKVYEAKAQALGAEVHQLLTSKEVQPIAFLNHKGQDVLFIPRPDGSRAIHRKIRSSARHAGFIPSPDQTREIWLKEKDPISIFESLGLPVASLATQGIAKIPIVCPDIGSLISLNTAKQFASFGNEEGAPPYLQILPEATFGLLKGLADRNVDDAFAKAGLTDLLQVSYFKIINSMGQANMVKDNLPLFLNEIESIHQEIQNILSIVSIKDGYGSDDFEISAKARLTAGDSPIVPGDVPDPKVFLKPSAMHALSSTIASVEAQKKDNHLNVAVLKNSYYESVSTLANKTYKLSFLDGDKFLQQPQTLGFTIPPKDPLDLFICEFHHNIQASRTEYHAEDITAQLIAMSEKGLLAEKCTVMIDMTMDLEDSSELRGLLRNQTIKKLINEGHLNLVFMRSGQKFDMLGMDNYYGGIVTTINSGGSFEDFNSRMSLKEDQLSGLSYQGMTHLAKYSGDSPDKYRKKIMENTKLLYDNLPPQMHRETGRKNPIKVSTLNDDRLVYLDFKPQKWKTVDFQGIFFDAVMKTALKRKLPYTARSSFGFPITNGTGIKDIGYRHNPGLEKPEDIIAYSKIFKDLQNAMDEAQLEADRYGYDDLQTLSLTLKKMRAVYAEK